MTPVLTSPTNLRKPIPIIILLTLICIWEEVFLLEMLIMMVWRISFLRATWFPINCILIKETLQFEDISESAGITGDERWYSGTTMVDINQDGFLDIYCSVGGKNPPNNNVLYINNQDHTFTEQARSLWYRL